MNYKIKHTASTIRIILLVFASIFARTGSGQISIASLPYNPAVTNFNSYNPNSSANLLATIPAGWTAASTGTQVYNGQGNGSSATGGYWAYGATASGEYSLGALRSATPGNITYTISFVNNSGATIQAINLSWDYEQWRYNNTSGWDCSGTGGLAGNATLNAKDFTGSATGTNTVVTVTPVALFTLSGLSIANGASFGISWVTTDAALGDNGISIDNFNISICSTPSIVPGVNPNVCLGASTINLSYNNAMGSPDQYSIDYNAAANSAGFVDVTNMPLLPNNIALAVPPAAPIGNYNGTLTVTNSTGGCVSAGYNIVVHIIGCTAPYMKWVHLQPGSVHGTCTSTTNCTPGSGNVVCYGLQYTPNHTGTLTSYTTGFFVDCSGNGNPIISNNSCTMNDHSMVDTGCVQFGLVKINCSGNTGSIPVTINVPVIIHQLCLAIPSGMSLNISEDMITNLTASIDLSGGGFVTEEPGYTTFSASWEQECVTLPLRWLDFQANRYDDLMSALEWTSADEINNAYFEVQRSNDNGLHFLTIGTVYAASRNEPVNSYEFIDRKAMTGKNLYRLKQVDFDGRYDYSPVRTVTFNSGAFNVNAWPNPASSDVTITINHAEDPGSIMLIDLTGKQVLNKIFDRGTSEQSIEINNLQPGMYTLIVTSGENRHVEKIVIMK